MLARIAGKDRRDSFLASSRGTQSDLRHYAVRARLHPHPHAYAAAGGNLFPSPYCRFSQATSLTSGASEMRAFFICWPRLLFPRTGMLSLRDTWWFRKWAQHLQ